MTRRQQWYLLTAILSVVAVGLTGFSMLQKAEYSVINAGTPAPDFTARTLDSVPVTRTLADYRGNVVLINIWRTDCPPCIQEMPTLEALHREFRDRGLRVVAVSVDAPGMENRIREFVGDLKLTFDVLYNPERDIEDKYRTRAVPESFVIGRDGIITRKVWGADDWSSLPNRALIAQLLGAAITPPEVPKQTVQDRGTGSGY
jgi:peroxiredoxin